METLRTPFFIAAAALIVLAVLFETGTSLFIKTDSPSTTQLAGIIPATGELRDAFASASPTELANLSKGDRPPGLAIPYLALLDGLVVFTVGLIATSLFIPQRVQARAQGCVTLIVALLFILAAIVLIFTAFGKLMFMVSLFLSVPFGTITYLAVFGFFDRGGANSALSLLMVFKIGFAICLIAAQQRFMQNIGLMLIILTSILGNIIIGFLHGFVPGFLVSISDAIAAIIVAILAVIWAIFLLVGALPAIIRALRVDRA